MRTIRWRNGQCPGRNGQWAERIAHAGSEAARLVPLFQLASCFPRLSAEYLVSAWRLPLCRDAVRINLPGKANFPRTKASFWREIRSSAFASQYRLCSTSLSAPPSRRKQLQVDGGLRRDIEQCLTASFVPRSARCRVHCRLLRALLARAYCQPVLVACSRSAAVGRTARRLAVGNARYLPYFLQNALLVASISLYKLTS